MGHINFVFFYPVGEKKVPDVDMSCPFAVRSPVGDKLDSGFIVLKYDGWSVGVSLSYDELSGP